MMELHSNKGLCCYAVFVSLIIKISYCYHASNATATQEFNVRRSRKDVNENTFHTTKTAIQLKNHESGLVSVS